MYNDADLLTCGQCETSKAIEMIMQSVNDIQLSIESGGNAFARYDIYTGEYVVTPHTKNEKILDTSQKIMTDDVRVLKIPYFETSNLSDGYTVYIGEI